MILPLGTVSSFTSVVFTLKPRFSSACCAGSAGLPVKSGILIGRGPLLTTTPTAALRRSEVPAAGSVLITRPLAIFSS